MSAGSRGNFLILLFHGFPNFSDICFFFAKSADPDQTAPMSACFGNPS